MKIKKIYTALLMIFVVSLTCTGCAKCISTENSTVEVKIINKYYRSAYITPMRAGKVTTMVTHPSVHRITVEYNGVEYSINDTETYNKYYNKVGEYANGTLQTKKYDNGSVKYDIIELE